MFRYKHRLVACLLMISVSGLCAASAGYAQEQQEAAVQTQEEPAYSYSEIDPNLYEGVWLSFDPGFDLYLPSDWYELPVSAEDEAQGAIYQCGPDQKGESGCLYFQQNQRYNQSLETFEEAFADYGCTDFSYASANGIRFLEYENPQMDTRGLTFIMPDGMLYSLLLSPSSDEEFSRIWENVKRSLSPSSE